MHQNKGFTIIELMIVVALVGILAMLALPMYADYTAKAQTAEGESLLKGLKSPLVEAVSNGGIGECNAQEEWFTSQVRSGNYVGNIALSSNEANRQCLLVATFKTSGINDKVAGKKISMRYSATTRSMGMRLGFECQYYLFCMQRLALEFQLSAVGTISRPKAA